MSQLLVNVTTRIRQSRVGIISLGILAPLANCRAKLAHVSSSPPNNASTAAAHALGGGVTPS